MDRFGKEQSSDQSFGTMRVEERESAHAGGRKQDHAACRSIFRHVLVNIQDNVLFQTCAQSIIQILTAGKLCHQFPTMNPMSPILSAPIPPHFPKPLGHLVVQSAVDTEV